MVTSRPVTVDRRFGVLSLRFFGDDAVYAERPTPAPAPMVEGLHDDLIAGQALRHPAFPRLRPSPLGFDTIPLPKGHGDAQTLEASVQGRAENEL